MKCGENGHLTVHGLPCGQELKKRGETACLWHSRTKEERTALAAKGHLVSRMKKALPEGAVKFTFADEDAVIAFAEDMARQALTKDVDQHRIKTGLEAAKVALSGFGHKTTARMVKALESLEHGGAAMVLLSQMQERLGTGTRRMIPGRVVQRDVEPREKGDEETAA